MKVLVVGATGHVGSYLVKRLVKQGYEVHAVMRGNRKPYGDNELWEKVHTYTMTRSTLCESSLIEEICPDIVCDLIAYHIDEVKGILGKIGNAFYLLVGSIWTYENKLYLPVDEEHPKNSIDEYGKQKGIMEDYILGLCKENKIRATVIHPGHVSAKEWTPINPQGNVDVEVFKRIIKGEKILLPFYGLNTLQHIHSDDLAKIIVASIEKQDISNGQAFIAVAKKAMTLKAISENLYKRFGHEPNIEYVEWTEFEREVGKENADVTYDHVIHSPCCTGEKVEKLLGVECEYTIDDIMNEFIDYQKLG